MNIFGIGLLLFQVQLGSASGIVTKPGGTEPLSGATVTLSPAASSQASLPPGVVLNPAVPSQNPRVRTVSSQDDGRFAITDIEPGEYRLQVQSPRFGSAAYGQRKPGGPGSVLTIAAGQRLSDLRVSMVPTGTIAGRITGRSGEPIANASVQAMKYVYLEGKRVLSVVQTTSTDDRGEYRLFWLTGGKYVVIAATRGSSLSVGTTVPIKPGETVRSGEVALTIAMLGLVSDSLIDGNNLVRRILEDGTIQEESWTPTYYPSTIDPSQATAVDVTEGATVPGINITLGPSRVQKIRGRVIGVSPGSQATVALAYGAQGTIGRLINKGASTIDGSFEFAGVVPGLYYLTAQDRTGLASTPIPVLVSERDVENLSIPLSSSVTMSARITVDGVTPGARDPLAGLMGMLKPEIGTSLGNAAIRSVALAPGSNMMTFLNIPPGGYQFNISQANPGVFVQGAPRESVPGLYIKSVRFGREDALGTLHVSSDTSNGVLDVVLSTGTGSVSGTALGRAGDPAANITVVLVPTNARKRTAFYQAAVTSSDGKFHFQEIPPGDYKLFAWDDVETGAWENAEFISVYEPRGRAVRVSENSKDDVTLNVIYNP
jgi:Carboxypeptidase regulatory-like domain